MATKRCLKRKNGPGSACLKWSKGSAKKRTSGKKKSGCQFVTIKGRKAKMCFRMVKAKKGSSKKVRRMVFVKKAA